MVQRTGNRLFAPDVLLHHGSDITLHNGMVIKALVAWNSDNLIELEQSINREQHQVYIPTYNLRGLEVGNNIIIENIVYHVNNVNIDMDEWATIAVARTATQLPEEGTRLTWDGDALLYNNQRLDWQAYR